MRRAREAARRRSWAGAFNVVLASGIVSIGARSFGLHAVSIVLLALAIVAFLPIAGLDVGRARRPATLFRQARVPAKGLPALGFVAAISVLGTRIALLGGGGARTIGAALLGVGALVWLSIMASVLPGLARAEVVGGDLAEQVRGHWLLGVVSTEGLAVLMGILSQGRHSALHFAAIALWVFGGLLYLAIGWLLSMRVRTHPLSPREFTPDLWILMGGIAIFSVAGATLLHGSAGSPAGVVVILGWALATAWIPVLVFGEAWRTARLGRPRFSPEGWTMVFPLGMYSVCGVRTGSAFGVPWIEHVGHWWFPVALVAWIVAAAGELRFDFRGARPGRSGSS